MRILISLCQLTAKLIGGITLISTISAAHAMECSECVSYYKQTCLKKSLEVTSIQVSCEPGKPEDCSCRVVCSDSHPYGANCTDTTKGKVKPARESVQKSPPIDKQDNERIRY